MIYLYFSLTAEIAKIHEIFSALSPVYNIRVFIGQQARL